MGTTSGSKRKYVQFDTTELSGAILNLLVTNGWVEKDAANLEIDIEVRGSTAVITIWK